MSSRTLRRSIRNIVYGELRSRLNSEGMNVTDKRVGAVMDVLRDDYGYDNVKRDDISRETRRFVTELERT